MTGNKVAQYGFWLAVVALGVFMALDQHPVIGGWMIFLGIFVAGNAA